MDNRENTNYIIICDLAGNTLEQLPQDFNWMLRKGNNVVEIIAEEHHARFFDFLSGIKQNDYLMGYEFQMMVNDKPGAYLLSGYLKNNSIHITCMVQDQITSDIIKEIIKINNLQVNQIRTLYKEQSMRKYRNEDEIYAEIVHLNNDLINTKRTIEKQNAELSKYNRLLKDLAMKDHLTSAYNRRFFYEVIPEISKRRRSEPMVLHFAAIDLNNFKKVNDLLGHDFGDRVLIALVDMIRENLAEEDLIFRLGGDEFLVVFINRTKEEAETTLEVIAEKYKKLSDISSISYGIAEVPLEEEPLREYQIEHYLRQADDAMYRHKILTKQNEHQLTKT